MRFLTLVAIWLAACGTTLAQAQISLQPAPASSAAPPALIGSWGTAAQCARQTAGKTDNPGRLPYQISHDWIRQGFLYCQMTWRGQQPSGDATRYYAHAQCGEDDLRDYRITLLLRQRRLEIRWSPDFSTAALEPCRGTGGE